MLDHAVANRLRKYCFYGVIAVLFMANALDMRADQSIALRSGNGSIGSQDAQVRFLWYGTTGNITPAAQDFVTAQTGTFAYVDTPYSTYLYPLPTGPLAQWMGTNNALQGGSALYAIPFMVTDPVIAAASLDLGYAVDNAINGVYINGQPISNNPLDGDYHGEYYVLRSDIAPLLVPNSINWLYINVSDYGDLSGLIFNANITTQGGAPGAPTISPNQGGNAGQVSVRVIASGFQPDAQITLTGAGPTITGTNVTVVSPNILTATLDLTGATPGVGTVTVTNTAERTSTVLNNAFTVEAGGAANVQINKIGTPAVDGRNETFYITLTNTGNVDSGPTSATELMEPWFTFVTADPPLTTSQAVGYPYGQDYNGYLEWTLPNVPSGQSATVAYNVTLAPGTPAGVSVEGPVCGGLVKPYCDGITASEIAIVVPAACTLELFLAEPAAPFLCYETVGAAFGTYVACEKALGYLCSTFVSAVRQSTDPNNLTGPLGYGTPMWIAAPQQMQYTLSFNNLATATNPATNVYITDTFDPSTLDLTTLVVGAVNFGNTNYALPNISLTTQPFSQDIDLRPTQDLIVRVTGALNSTTNQATVNFLSLDPATGLTPADPTVGFLEPGTGGSVIFTLNSKPGFTTGTTIQDSGSVVFDSNAAINTNAWSNSIDITPPMSQVIALPTTETTPNFTVAWTGTDLGSGIQHYSIYVSDNGGAFTPWQTATTLTSASYTGATGHTYGFYSIATDNVGNVEGAKSAPDTSAQVVLPATTTALQASTTAAVPGQLVTLTATVAGPPGSTKTPAGTVNFLSGTTSLGTQMVNASGVATLSIALPLGIDSVTAGYSGDSNYAASTSSAISVTVAPAPTYSLAVTAASVTIAAGNSGTVTLNLTSTNYAGTVTLAASSTSGMVSASATSVTLTNGGSGSSTVTITASTSAASHVPAIPWRSSGAVMFYAVLLGTPFTLRRKRVLAVLLTAVTISLAGFSIACGGNVKASRTYTVTVIPMGSGTVTNPASVSFTVKVL